MSKKAKEQLLKLAIKWVTYDRPGRYSKTKQKKRAILADCLRLSKQAGVPWAEARDRAQKIQQKLTAAHVEDGRPGGIQEEADRLHDEAEKMVREFVGV